MDTEDKACIDAEKCFIDKAGKTGLPGAAVIRSDDILAIHQHYGNVSIGVTVIDTIHGLVSAQAIWSPLFHTDISKTGAIPTMA